MSQSLESQKREELAAALGLPAGASGFAIFLSILTTAISFIKDNPQIVDLVKRLFPKLFSANGDSGPVAQ